MLDIFLFKNNDISNQNNQIQQFNDWYQKTKQEINKNRKIQIKSYKKRLENIIEKLTIDNNNLLSQEIKLIYKQYEENLKNTECIFDISFKDSNKSDLDLDKLYNNEIKSIKNKMKWTIKYICSQYRKKLNNKIAILKNNHKQTIQLTNELYLSNIENINNQYQNNIKEFLYNNDYYHCNDNFVKSNKINVY